MLDMVEAITVEDVRHISVSKIIPSHPESDDLLSEVALRNAVHIFLVKHPVLDFECLDVRLESKFC